MERHAGSELGVPPAASIEALGDVIEYAKRLHRPSVVNASGKHHS